MNADGSNQVNLTSDSAFDDRDPAFAPDGRIVFERDFGGGDRDIIIMDGGGSDEEN